MQPCRGRKHSGLYSKASAVALLFQRVPGGCSPMVEVENVRANSDRCQVSEALLKPGPNSDGPFKATVAWSQSGASLLLLPLRQPASPRGRYGTLGAPRTWPLAGVRQGMPQLQSSWSLGFLRCKEASNKPVTKGSFPTGFSTGEMPNVIGLILCVILQHTSAVLCLLGVQPWQWRWNPFDTQPHYNRPTRKLRLHYESGTNDCPMTLVFCLGPVHSSGFLLALLFLMRPVVRGQTFALLCLI